MKKLRKLYRIFIIKWDWGVKIIEKDIAKKFTGQTYFLLVDAIRRKHIEYSEKSFLGHLKWVFTVIIYNKYI